MTSLLLPPLSVYYCYHPADLAFCKVLDIHLDPLKRRGWIQTWDDQQILAGAEPERERDTHLHTARLLFLLISADFLASELGIHMIEVALQRHRDGEAVAIPILVRAANWEETGLQILQLLPREQKAIATWSDQDTIWHEVARELQRVIETMRQWVFVVSSPEDLAFVERLRQDMISAHVLLWSQEKSQDEAQRDAMRAASAVILVASLDAPSSYLVKAQLALALDYQRPILVVWARGEDWKSSNPGHWREQDVIDVRGRSYESARKTLLISLREVVVALPPLIYPDTYTEPRNPYKGLHAFTSNDAGDFFGRKTLIEQLATAIETMLTREKKDKQYQRLLPIIGPSGSGKSSLVMAGLFPCLQSGGVFDSEGWTYLDPVFPGTHPLEALAVSLAQQFPARSVLSLLKDFTSDSKRALHLLACQLVHPSRGKVVLMVDQFEELFTLTASEEERQRFLDLLVTAVTEPSGPLLVILTLRADFYDRLMQYPEFYRLFDERHISILPMESEDLRMVIEQPARLPDVQLTFDRDLVGDLLFEMRGQAGALPLLQFTLDQLFEQRDGHLLSLQAYHKIGGVKGALSQHAERTYTELPSDGQRRFARDIFLRLIEPGMTEQDTTRRRAALSEFDLAEASEQQQMQETLDAFVKARLLTTNQNRGTTTVEVSHEAVIREWKRLVEWLHEAQEDIHFLQSLREDVAEWEQRKQPRDRLYRGAQFKEAQDWTKRNRPSEREQKFLRASATQQTLRFTSIIVVALLLVSAIVTAGGFFVVNQAIHPDPTLVTTLQDNELGSLRYCIENADSGSTIHFAANLRGTIYLKDSLSFPGDKQITLQGPGADKVTISGGDNTLAIIQVPPSAIVTISDLSFKNSHTAIDAFLTNIGNLTLSNDVISGNTTNSSAASYGGGVYNNGGTLTVQNSIISNNSATSQRNGQGGGIENNVGKVTVINSTFSNNSASGGSGGFGGGIFSYQGGTVMIEASTFSNNSASGKQSGAGGSIDNAGKVTVVNSTFSKNSASGTNGSTGFGGGIYNENTGTAMIETSTFAENSANGDKNGQGGGIDNEGKVTVVNSTFSKNSASGSSNSTGFGGGIDNYKTGTILVEAGTFSGNSASGDQNSQGGGIDNSGVGTLTNSIVAANSAPNGPDISGTLYSGGYNLLTNVTSHTPIDKQVTLDDLKLDQTLGDNGGPTQTLKLLLGSVAIDAIPQQACSITVTDPVSGKTMTITTDQRGDFRPDGSESACDVGAFESSY